MNERKYQICTNCVMDTSDSEIIFDENGVCSHCKNFENHNKHWFKGEKGKIKLEKIVNNIKKERENSEYDVITGLSGGIDSSYTIYLAHKLGLRALIVHMDNGWNSELAVHNIEALINHTGFDLFTYVVNWEEFKDLQLSFIKASVANLEVPTDHAINALMYKIASEKNIPYILSGSNIATEAIMPNNWGYDNKDLQHLMSIHKKFGTQKLKTFPKLNFFKFIYYRYFKRFTIIKPLNYINYNKDEAISILEKDVEWRYYGGKHYESIFTKYFQAYMLPKKFKYDKRRAHLSSLINAGQMTRESALYELGKDIYTKRSLEEDTEYIIKKFGLTKNEFNEIMNLPCKTYRDYPSNYIWFKFVDKLINKIKFFLKRG